jgi:hypothetical protein
MHEHIAVVADEAVGIVAGVRARSANDLPIDLELLLLPLVHRDRSQTRLLGVLAPIDRPTWLGVHALADLTCGPLRHLGVETLVAPRLVSVSDEPSLVPDAESVGLRRGLVVYDGGRS